MFDILEISNVSETIILRNICYNAYKFDIPNDMDISLVFNVAYLYKYHKEFM